MCKIYLRFGKRIKKVKMPEDKYTIIISNHLVVEDLRFKISEGSDQNWCFPGSAVLAVSAKLRQLNEQSQKNTNLGPNILKF